MSKQKKPERARKIWTEEEENYLREHWGTTSVKSIAGHLKRSPNAIIVRKDRLKLGSYLERGEYVTYNQLMSILGISNGASAYRSISWVQNRAFPVREKRVLNNTFRVVCLNEFWKWAEKNRSMINFSRLEPNILGKEPKWVKLQRQLDADDFKTTPWEKWEDEKLLFLLRKFEYGYYELSLELNRSSGAIERRVIDLGLKERPVKAENHIKWQTSEIEDMKHFISLGYNYKGLAKAIGKSDKAIRGRVYVLYGTENLDKAREIMKTP